MTVKAGELRARKNPVGIPSGPGVFQGLTTPSALAMSAFMIVILTSTQPVGALLSGIPLGRATRGKNLTVKIRSVSSRAITSSAQS